MVVTVRAATDMSHPGAERFSPEKHYHETPEASPVGGFAHFKSEAWDLVSVANAVPRGDNVMMARRGGGTS